MFPVWTNLNMTPPAMIGKSQRAIVRVISGRLVLTRSRKRRGKNQERGQAPVPTSVGDHARADIDLHPAAHA